MQKLTRRQILLTGAAVTAPAMIGCRVALDTAPAGREDAPPPLSLRPIAQPSVATPTVDSGGPSDAGRSMFVAPGRVVEVHAPGAVVNGTVQATRVRTALREGMLALTEEATEEAAWGALFSAEDLVVLKVNPFGWPNVFTRPETVVEIVRGLNLVGVPNSRIVVYDRYTDYLAQPGYEAALPAGVRVTGAVLTTAEQTDTTKHDLSQFVEFSTVDDGLDATVEKNRRSYLADVVANEATKVINVPVLKSHWTAGFTAALKNMTYGLVNNTARTHGKSNWTTQFLPVVAGMKALRDKVVLHVGDLLVGCYAGGPEASTSTFDYESLALATDPVALDRICWQIIDDERAKRELTPVATMENATPGYVFECGAAGLGIADLAIIDRRTRAV